MTVIATIITSHFTAHGTDSFVTRPNADGTYELLESQDTKIVRVPRWRGAISYWGLASDNAGWSTLKWLRDRAAEAERYASAEEFARSIAADLTSELSARRFRTPLHRGIGMHFTAYERIRGYWIPELFHIRNWVTPAYDAVDPAGVSVTRETYGAVQRTKRLDEHREPLYRLAVHRALQSGRMLVFNNGDPRLFNPIAESLFTAMEEVHRRGLLRDPTDAETHLALVRRPIEVVSGLLRDFAKPNMRIIGGKPHDLAIAPSGDVTSTTGDA
jgi:hypothetical protein